MSVNMETDVIALFRDAAVGGKRDMDLVPDAGDVNDQVVRALASQFAGKRSNHLFMPKLCDRRRPSGRPRFWPAAAGMTNF
jgi:hypothetical protein